MKAVRRNARSECRVAGDEKQERAFMCDGRKVPCQRRAPRIVACAQDDEAAARQSACGGSRIGNAPVVGHEDQRR